MKNTTFKRDTVKDGVLAGLLGTFVDTLIHSTAYLILKTTMTAHYISQLLFPFKEVNIVRFSFGFFTHLIAGATVGVLFAIIFKLSGRDYPYLKGVGLGSVLWIIHVIVIPNLITARPYVFRSELESVVDLTAHVVYGIVVAYYLSRLETYSFNEE